ncbi:hypothetical protein EMIHUDRAFT_208389 [Emiliania huxleyi CCMP1516]|uniref:5-hmdU DNA kinase helical domain-containing protein n=2 Tax=Emiliania huxleyi TaxID=2903 RepID=A0A0D3JAG9_EMIH1|nr:hypothetical protein EMIHUDRAFT_208389 [Emiliania huxleyi CCMP1516]EOD20504.1 hypothetical protein EMIHUDRAFT_208389 [Emiliania huxleyi CCMP1516]|eukprot:XP_005772933.1 hypothetical protein EMIHUDRAFT_208389 [Emiliania huxleyi CCMP1516]
MAARKMIGRCVSVYWPEDERYYDGIIVSYASTRNGDRIHIRYSDGELLPIGEGETLHFPNDADKTYPAPRHTDKTYPAPRHTAAGRKRAAPSEVSTSNAPKPDAPEKPKKKAKLKPCDPEAHRKISVKSERNVELFYRYLHRRMCVRLQMDRDKARPPLATVLGVGVTLPVPHDPVLALATTGNAYRHLDTGTLTLGSDVKAALVEHGRTQGSSDYFAGALMACLVDMSGINASVLRQGLQLPRWEHAAPGERVLEYPCTLEELAQLRRFIGAYQKKQQKAGFKGTKLFSDAGFQTQGFRWIEYLAQWLRPASSSEASADPAACCRFAEVAAQVRDSSTWQEANLTVQTLPGVGGYTGAQALLQVLYGVFGGEVAACFTPSFAEASMRDWCAYGPGPVSSCNKLFGTADGETLAGIRWLQEHQQERFATYGLDFPYLQQADGTPRLLAACDLEHSLCYFSRYLSARASLGAAGAEALSRAMPAGFRLYRIGKLQGLSAAKVWEDFDAHRDAGAGGGLGAGPTTDHKSRHY